VYTAFETADVESCSTVGASPLTRSTMSPALNPPAARAMGQRRARGGLRRVRPSHRQHHRLGHLPPWQVPRGAAPLRRRWRHSAGVRVLERRAAGRTEVVRRRSGLARLLDGAWQQAPGGSVSAQQERPTHLARVRRPVDQQTRRRVVRHERQAEHRQPLRREGLGAFDRAVPVGQAPWPEPKVQRLHRRCARRREVRPRQAAERRREALQQGRRAAGEDRLRRRPRQLHRDRVLRRR